MRHFAVYYGIGNLDKLATYELVVLQAENYTSQELRQLTDRQIRVLAYLSVGSLPAKEVNPAWLLRDSSTGGVIEDPRWGTAVIDCGASGWHDFVLQQRIPELLARGATGIFLDTVDVQESHPVIRDGMVKLLHTIREEFAVELLINRGFGILDTVLAVSDGLVFESFTSYHDGCAYREWTGEDLAWTAQMAVRLSELRGQLPVLAVDYAAPTNTKLRRRAARRAQVYGFRSFVTTYDLNWLP